ncbi:hypothetical protein NSE01_28990 [Novosphingobium sediminis]|uniref:TauD/TfdA-like domain-containing protein n=1 Tax=Novosphingobium sediminis TaxID=707214 RepID=A0A512AN96_9SPHN|nr:TauD/TfdA family dioxygenase [Novosphingobium sediminis]GEO01067.1 hypothetical protein NSE01_28990 [Novosphingobium sediminis]
MASDEVGLHSSTGLGGAIMTLDRSGLADLLIGDQEWLLTRLEDMEVIVVRQAFCPVKPLRSFAERLDAMLHGPLAPACVPTPEDYLIVGDPKVSALAEYLQNSRVWESDHVMGRAPGGVSIMAIPGEGSIATPTEFACTAAAWDGLAPGEQRELASLSVLHGFWQDRLYHEREPRHEALMQWMARQSAELPLVQPLPGGRHGLLIDDTAIQLVDVEFSQSEAFLGDLRNWVTQPAYVYRHTWQPGDLVIWNSASVMYRDLPRPDNPIWKMAQSRRG